MSAGEGLIILSWIIVFSFVINFGAKSTLSTLSYINLG